MGLADRDYARARPRSGGGRGAGGASGLPGAYPGGFLSGPRNWSITTWLIAICVGVFLIDVALFSAGAVVETSMGIVKRPGFEQAGQREVMKELEFAATIPPGSGWLAHPVIDASRPITGPIPDGVAWVSVRGAAYEVIGEKRFLRYPPLVSIGLFSTGKGFLELEVWRLVLYQFLHADVVHLLFNAIGLFFFGPVIEQHLRSRRTFLGFYLACGMAGALFYLLLNLLGNLLPVQAAALLVHDVYTPLIGASAGVFGVLAASAVVAPKETLYLFFVIPMPMRVAAVLLLGGELWYLITGASNAGGHAAHVGGAIAGLFLIRRPQLVAGFFDDFFPRKRAGAAAATRAERAGRAAAQSDAARVDGLLAKVGKFGEGSLTDEERAFLERVSKSRP